jgi:hypothetical protein
MAKRQKTEKPASVALTMAQYRVIAIAESEDYKRHHLEIADDEPLLAANGKLVDAIAREMGFAHG